MAMRDISKSVQICTLMRLATRLLLPLRGH